MSRFEREMRREMRGHVAERTAELRASGLSRRAALRQARIEFGSMDKYQELCRETSRLPYWDAFAKDLQHALRSLRRQPLLAFTVVATLGIGMGVSAALFSLVNAVALEPPVANAGFVRIYSTTADGGLLGGTWREYTAYRESAAFATLAAWAPAGAVHLHGGSAADLPVLVTCNFFQVYGTAAPIAGRWLSSGDCAQRRAVVVIASTLARERFGAEDTGLGRTLAFNDHNLTVIGIVRTPYAGQIDQIGAVAWIPGTLSSLLNGKPGWEERPDTPQLAIEGRLQRGASQAQAATAVRAIAANLDAEHPWLGGHTQVEVSNGSLAQTPGVGATALWAIGLATFLASLLALIAAANITGVLLARANRRHREVAVRLALGASRARILRLLATETLLLVAIAAAGALWIAAALPRLIAARLSGPGQPFTLHRLAPDARVLGYLALLALLAGLLAALSPALESLRFQLVETLKGRNSLLAQPSRHGRSLLTVAQAALSLVLLTTALAFTAAQRGVLQRAVEGHGYDAAHVLWLELTPRDAVLPPAPSPARARALAQRLAALPGVQGVAFASLPPVFSEQLELRGPGGEPWSVPTDRVSPEFFAVAGIPMIAGRGFSRDDADCAAPVCPVVVSREFLRRDPDARVGTLLRPMDSRNQALPPTLEIVGVAANTTDQLQDLPQAIVYQAWSPGHEAYGMLVRFHGPAAPAQSMVAGVLRQTHPDTDVVVRTLAELVLRRAQIVSRGRLAQVRALLVVLGAGAVALTMLGLYGTLAFQMARRAHELGIRTALGATRADMYRLALRATAVPLGWGLAAGLGLYAALATGLHALTSGPGGLTIFFWQPQVVAAGIALLVAAAALAVWRPARRATRLDPMAALREE